MLPAILPAVAACAFTPRRKKDLKDGKVVLFSSEREMRFQKKIEKFTYRFFEASVADLILNYPKGVAEDWLGTCVYTVSARFRAHHLPIDSILANTGALPAAMDTDQCSDPEITAITAAVQRRALLTDGACRAIALACSDAQSAGVSPREVLPLAIEQVGREITEAARLLDQTHFSVFNGRDMPNARDLETAIGSLLAHAAYNDPDNEALRELDVTTAKSFDAVWFKRWAFVSE